MGPSTPSGAGDAPAPTQSSAAAPDGAPRAAGPSGPRTLRRYEVELDRGSIDPDVRKVVRRLSRHGHEAFLVGGCVRDLLLGCVPKDFDVATSARPEEVRALFRNSRIIGRRFRLVHVMFQRRKVIEVATFRSNPGASATGELIRTDNTYGEAHEDAARRDFTINALFYDPERHQIFDWVGGMADIRRRRVCTIGEPEARFNEDPVRILRAIKFAGRLDLGIAAEVYDAIVYCRETLRLSARPRVAEEMLRLMRGGQARRSIYIAWETGVLEVLLPELAAMLYEADDDDSPGARVWRQLAFIDRRHREGKPLEDTALWTLLLLEPMKEACEGRRNRSAAAGELLETVSERLAITRRAAEGMRRITAALPRLHAGRPGRLARSSSFPLVLDVAEADCLSEGRSAQQILSLREAYRDRAARGPRIG